MEFTFETPDWNAPAGRLLKQLAEKLPSDPPRTVIVFGSAPLQLLVDSKFLSRDVDIMGEEDIKAAANELALPGEGESLTFQVCDLTTFRTAAGWQQRATVATMAGHTFIFPHPWDILVAKVVRLEKKDLEAFELVIAKTGHPTAEEFKQHLQLAVDLYRPNFDEERGSDYTQQTRYLWQEIFRGEIDVRAEIIRPALMRRQAHYDADAGDPAWKERLRRLGT